MDAPNPLAMEGRDAVAHPPVAPPWAGASADEGSVERRGNADRDKFEQPAAAATAAAGELSILWRRFKLSPPPLLLLRKTDTLRWRLLCLSETVVRVTRVTGKSDERMGGFVLLPSIGSSAICDYSPRQNDMSCSER